MPSTAFRTLVALALAGPGLTAEPAAPPLLSQTGLYAAPGRIDPRNLPYAPQYPLWSDGAAKSRWLRLPPGSVIGTREPLAWDFPVGTKVWKEFQFGGRRVETRLIWKTGPDRWVFASYAWNAAQDEARLAPPEGLKAVVALASGKAHDLPSVADCLACHSPGGRPGLLGLNALQLSPDRDPGAIHGEPLRPGMATLASLERGHRFRPRRPEWLRRPPRIPAANPLERAVRGYLASNCGNCHEGGRPPNPAGLDLRAIARAGAGGAAAGIVPGEPGRSLLATRMASRDPAEQMPPLATVLPDEEALAKVRAWIRGLGGSPAAPEP